MIRLPTARTAVLVAGICAALVLGALATKDAAGRHRVAGLAAARERLLPLLAAKGLELGAPVFIRIFKQSRELEVWLQRDSDSKWLLLHSYPICNYSGHLGPKLREGDRQSPEGLYWVGLKQLNPGSRYHLAFNLGFPNSFDRALGRSGSYLMVHGNCVSIGCYAMTDRGIEEIYALVEAALKNGQPRFQVQAFPARLTESWLAAQVESRWADFWRDLKPCYEAFETKRTPPAPRIVDRRYVCS